MPGLQAPRRQAHSRWEQGETIIRPRGAGIEIPARVLAPRAHRAGQLPNVPRRDSCRSPGSCTRPRRARVGPGDQEARASKPKLQPSCYMAAAEGMEVLADSSEHVRKARHDVQEFLLLNHPVDCPICDQSGECKLQDYWLDYGRYQKRMRDEPVHKPKGVVFGPTIVYDGERCVMCTRCIRFMDEVAKDPVLDMRERGNLNEIVVAPGRQLEGHYTFMTEHVCPVGALTTKDQLSAFGFLAPRRRSARAARPAAMLTSTTTPGTIKPTAIARATTRRSTSSGCATRGCSRTRKRTTGA